MLFQCFNYRGDIYVGEVKSFNMEAIMEICIVHESQTDKTYAKNENLYYYKLDICLV